MELLIFTYDRLMYTDVMKRILHGYGDIQWKKPAMMQGKLYKCIGKTVAAVEHTKQFQYVYGYLYCIKGTPEVLRCLDGYEGCSKSFIGTNHVQDLFGRKEIEATVISFDSPEAFIKCRFDVHEKYVSHAYFGNTQHYKIASQLKDVRNYIGNLTNHFFNVYQDAI